MNAVRVLLPTWKFFDEIGPAPLLEMRLKDEDAEWGEWREALEHVPRNWTSLFLNAHGNLRLAQQTLLEKLVREAAELEPANASALADSPAYHLVCALVRYRLHGTLDAKGARALQFRIRLVGLKARSADGIDDSNIVLASAEFEV